MVLFDNFFFRGSFQNSFMRVHCAGVFRVEGSCIKLRRVSKAVKKGGLISLHHILDYFLSKSLHLHLSFPDLLIHTAQLTSFKLCLS